MNKSNLLTSSILTLIFLLTLGKTMAQPTFKSGQDPLTDKKWKLVKALSDEFNKKQLDLTKWKNTEPKGWIGRPPGLFKKDVVSMGDGSLQITNYLLPDTVIKHQKAFTHAGGNITSIKSAEPGMYFECRVKASKTFMSTTFWLINDKRELEGCDKRVTELDIQESVGYVSTDSQWAQNFDQAMHSNTHSRHVTCQDSVGTVGSQAALPTKVYDDFHVFGAWWKNASEIQFFLNGVYLRTVEPVADFNLPMYIKLVTETYDWNPVPADGGMTGSKESRTSYYDWVRVWEPK